MKMIDFDNENVEEYDESAAEAETMGFNAPNPKQEEKETINDAETKEEVKEVVKKEKSVSRTSDNLNKTENKQNSNQKAGIKIEIDSVQRMISEIEYSTQAFNQAIDRVTNNNELAKVLEVLSQIKTNQFENFQNIEKNINIDKVERIIEEKILSSVSKIDKKINQNVKVIESKTKKATEQYKKYAEAFEDPDVLDQFANIEKIERWTKKFKFKTIIFSSIFASIISAVATAGGLNYFYQIQLEKAKQELKSKGEIVGEFLDKKDMQLYKGENSNQIIFSKNEKVKYFEAADGRKVLEFEK